MNELISTSDTDIVPLIKRAVLSVREDIRDNPYIIITTQFPKMSRPG